MKTKLKFIDANDSDGGDLTLCFYVYDVIYKGNHEVRIPGVIPVQDHLKYLKEKTYQEYKSHGIFEKFKQMMSIQ